MGIMVYSLLIYGNNAGILPSAVGFRAGLGLFGPELSTPKPCPEKRAQYPSIKEYTLNHNIKAPIS